MSGETPKPEVRGQRSGSATAASKGKAGAAAPDFDFNLGACKGRVIKTLDATAVPQQFRRFFASSLYDRMLQTCLLYFTAMFQLEWVIGAMDRARKQHLEGYNPYMVAQRIRELEAETAALRLDLSPLYSQVILKFSNYEKPQQDRKFFEALYDSMNSILDEAFERLKKRADIERELGLLFRSKHFNLYHRRNVAPRSVDTLSVKELYALKSETENRALNARMLASLFEKPPALAVTVASVTNSPLISQFIQSPIVARSMMKDPETRQKVLHISTTPSLGDHREQRRKIGNVFRSTAMLKGVDPSKLVADLASGRIKGGDNTDIGLMSAEKSRKGDAVRVHGMAAPEAAGLPADDAFNYLALMKRYVMYGPSLGLQPAATSPGAASGHAPPTPQMHASLLGSLQGGGSLRAGSMHGGSMLDGRF